MKRVLDIIWAVLKVVFPLVIIAGVGWHFFGILSRRELTETHFDIHLGWLLLSALLYLGAQSIWATFFVTALHSQSVSVPTGAALRAYFISQLGKYVPGKAWVVFMRVRSLQGYGIHRGAVVMAGFYETLTAMGAGALVALILLPWLGDTGETIWGWEWLFVVVLLLPMTIGISQRVVGKWSNRRAKKRAEVEGVAHQPIESRFRLLLLVRGTIRDSIGWALLGVSLWACVRGLTPWDEALTIELFLRFTGVVAVAYVAGFAALLLPGGVGVRELLIQTMIAAELTLILGPNQAAALAVVVALILRLVWTLAEMLLIGGLYLYRFGVGRGPAKTSVPDACLALPPDSRLNQT